MIKIDHLLFSYNDKQVIKDVSLALKTNEKVAIVGPSGCGKSTLLKLILGIYSDYQGEINVFGQPSKKINPNIGIVFQKNGLYEFLTVYQNLKLTKCTDDDILEIVKILGIESVLYQYPKNISGGQLQRANIARSLILNKQLLLLDEPTSNLDEFTKDEFQKQIINLNNSTNFGYILVTHDIKEAMVLSKRIFIMKDGKLITEYPSPYFGKLNNELEPEFNQLYLKIKEEFYV